MGVSAFSQAARVLVRRPGLTCVALRVPIRQEIELADGSRQWADPGDWQITQGKHTLALLSAKAFPAPYEIVQEGGLTLSAADRESLEQVAGVGATRTGADLVHAVQRLARIRIGEVEIPFTPGQLEELAHRAQKRGRSIQAEVQAVVDRIRDELFWKG